MKKYMILAMTFIAFSFTSMYAMNKTAELKKLLPAELGGEGRYPAFNATPDVFNPIAIENNAMRRIDYAKTYLSYIASMLDLVPGAIDDLPTIKGQYGQDIPGRFAAQRGKEWETNLKEKTKEILDKWKLSLEPINNVYFIQPQGPKTVEDAITQAKGAAKNVVAAAGAATVQQKIDIKAIATELNKLQ